MNQIKYYVSYWMNDPEFEPQAMVVSTPNNTLEECEDVIRRLVAKGVKEYKLYYEETLEVAVRQCIIVGSPFDRGE
jgi:hypothetical protein